MSEESGFLAQLYEHPEDDLTRLVYADWLQERDDVRGDYLRGEVELAALDERSERAPQREKALARLRESIRPEWLELAARRYDVYLLPAPPGDPLAPTPPPSLLQRNCLRHQAEATRDQVTHLSGRPSVVVQLRPAQRPRPRLTRFPAPGDPPGHALRLVRAAKRRQYDLVAVASAVRGCTHEEARALLAGGDLPLTIRTFRTAQEARQAAVRFRGYAQMEVRQVDPRGGVLDRPAAATFSVLLHAYPQEVKKQLVEVLSLMLGLSGARARALAARPLPLLVRSGLDWQGSEVYRLALPARATVEVREEPG